MWTCAEISWITGIPRKVRKCGQNGKTVRVHIRSSGSESSIVTICSREFPALTLRPTGWKNAIDELLWIWQKKTNDITKLNSHIWDAWAGEDNTIGKAYGYQLGKQYKFRQGMMDQVDNVIWQLKNTPASRRIMTNIYNFEDLSEMGLEPCAYSMTFNVTENRLNAILNQRSQDVLVANNWNVVQYAVLVHMLAQVCGYEPGELVHVIADAHIYDKSWYLMAGRTHRKDAVSWQPKFW